MECAARHDTHATQRHGRNSGRQSRAGERFVASTRYAISGARVANVRPPVPDLVGMRHIALLRAGHLRIIAEKYEVGMVGVEPWDSPSLDAEGFQVNSTTVARMRKSHISA